MSILNTSPRYVRATDDTTAIRADVAPLIEWSQPGEDLWVGKIHLDHAGMIELVGDRYVVTDWKNERVDSCPTLREAQAVLEPAARVAAQEQADRAIERHQWLASTTLATTLVAAAVVGGWAITSV